MTIEPINPNMNIPGTGAYEKANDIFTRGNKIQPASGNNEDSVVISPEGSSLDSLLNIESLLGFKPESPDKVTIEEIAAHAKEFLGDFNRNMMALFRENGIDTSIPVELGNAYFTGDVIVTNDHPDKEKIEALFEENPELRNEQIRIGNMFRLVNAAQDHEEFAKAYAENPQAAVRQYSYLFTTDIIMTMVLTEDGPDVLFSRA